MANKGVQDFEADLKKFSKKMGIEIGITVKKLAFDIFRGVVVKTPVRTGRARASWNISAGKADLSVAPPTLGDTGAEPAPFHKLGALALANPFTSIFITNNLDYIEFLEDGSSDQAPNGMVAVTLEEVQLFLKGASKI